MVRSTSADVLLPILLASALLKNVASGSPDHFVLPAVRVGGWDAAPSLLSLTQLLGHLLSHSREGVHKGGESEARIRQRADVLSDLWVPHPIDQVGHHLGARVHRGVRFRLLMHHTEVAVGILVAARALVLIVCAIGVIVHVVGANLDLIAPEVHVGRDSRVAKHPFDSLRSQVFKTRVGTFRVTDGQETAQLLEPLVIDVQVFRVKEILLDLREVVPADFLGDLGTAGGKVVQRGHKVLRLSLVRLKHFVEDVLARHVFPLVRVDAETRQAEPASCAPLPVPDSLIDHQGDTSLHVG